MPVPDKPSRAAPQPSLSAPEVWDPQDPRLIRVFAELPAASGLPGVHRIWRLLAAHPTFLTAAWPALAAALASGTQRLLASELIEASVLAEAVGMPSHKAFRGDLIRVEIDADLRERIERFNSASQMQVARLLVLAAAMREGTSGRAPHTAQGPDASAKPDSISAVFVPPLRPSERRGKAAEVLDRIEVEHGLPFLDDYYLCLARIPDFLSAAWNAIRPLVRDPAYLELGERLAAHAAARAGAEPLTAVAAQAIGSCAPSDRALVREQLSSWAERVLPETLIDIALIKALTSGPDKATSR